MRLCVQCRNTFDSAGWECPQCRFVPEIIEGFPAFAPEGADSSESYDAGYYSKLADVEDGNFWFRSRNSLILFALEQYFPYTNKFMEIGCGTGFVLSAVEKAFPQTLLYGSDIHSRGIGFAAGRCQRAELMRMDARNIPFMDEFDVIGAFDVLEHVGEDIAILIQMRKALKKGGGIVLTVPQHEFLWSSTDEYACHVRRYSRKELIEKAGKAGFQVIRATSFVSLLLPFMMMTRFKKRKIKHKFDIMDELRMGKGMNFILEKVLDLERRLIRSGVNFPFGGSLLLIAKKI